MKWQTTQRPIEVLIAIQARSTSTRFPNKIFERIGDKMVLDHVIAASKSVAEHIMRYTSKRKIQCQVALLYPTGDRRIMETFRQSGILLVDGNEHNVLSRYIKAQEQTAADYVVRLTSDCPLILDYVIAKHIHVATFNEHDYVSNVDEHCRFVADGFDCEVLSRRALDWLHENATSEFDKEHVTTKIRRERPAGLSQAFIASKLDTSGMKFSLDTKEDLDRIRDYYHDREHKLSVAKRMFGKSVYEL